mmetsp:Transcript_48856/g.96376  ORF Transcript_48856/g.96376 Transcript_48856/m.96376 type:complete len:132 (-) Transcript_48856:462-857(-)
MRVSFFSHRKSASCSTSKTPASKVPYFFSLPSLFYFRTLREIRYIHLSDDTRTLSVNAFPVSCTYSSLPQPSLLPACTPTYFRIQFLCIPPFSFKHAARLSDSTCFFRPLLDLVLPALTCRRLRGEREGRR